MEAYTVQVPDSCAATGAATGAGPSNALALAFIHYNQAQTR
jgi:hypothetical protein